MGDSGETWLKRMPAMRQCEDPLSEAFSLSFGLSIFGSHDPCFSVFHLIYSTRMFCLVFGARPVENNK